MTETSGPKVPGGSIRVMHSRETGVSVTAQGQPDGSFLLECDGCDLQQVVTVGDEVDGSMRHHMEWHADPEGFEERASRPELTKEEREKFQRAYNSWRSRR